MPGGRRARPRRHDVPDGDDGKPSLDDDPGDPRHPAPAAKTVRDQEQHDRRQARQDGSAEADS
jgi:hypothetical protein